MLLNVSELSKSFQSVKAVDNIAFALDSGTFLGLIGQNGAGKSTTIKMITGHLLPDDGEILFEGKSVDIDQISFRKQIFYVPQTPLFYDYLTGREYLSLIMSLYERPEPKTHREQIDGFLKTIDLPEGADRLMGEYSQGMVKKIVLGGALLSGAQLLILDEVFAGLDPVAIYRFKEMLGDAIKAGKTILFASHILDSVERLCQQIIIMKRGKIVDTLDHDALQNIKSKGESLEDYYIRTIQ